MILHVLHLNPPDGTSMALVLTDDGHGALVGHNCERFAHWSVVTGDEHVGGASVLSLEIEGCSPKAVSVIAEKVAPLVGADTWQVY